MDKSPKQNANGFAEQIVGASRQNIHGTRAIKNALKIGRSEREMSKYECIFRYEYRSQIRFKLSACTMNNKKNLPFACLIVKSRNSILPTFQKTKTTVKQDEIMKFNVLQKSFSNQIKFFLDFLLHQIIYHKKYR